MTPVDDTIPVRFLRTVTERHDDVALREKAGEHRTPLTFGDYADRGHPPRGRVCRPSAWAAATGS